MGRAKIGTLEELQARGCLAGKVGSQPVCVFLAGGRAFALDDRCPHMGFPLHRGSVEDGLLTCHWHHARFDLSSGGTLDPFADDVAAHDVELEDGQVYVRLRPVADPAGHHRARLVEGLEQGLTLVIAKSVLGLLDALGPGAGARAAIAEGVSFGTANRVEGWGAGLTVLTAMGNVLPVLRAPERVLALVHGLAFVSRDTRGHAPRFALAPLDTRVEHQHLASWYRRFCDTRNADSAERALLTLLAAGAGEEEAAGAMGAAVTDHLFVNGGHTIDFTNKAFEMLGLLGWEHAPQVLPTLVRQTALASRSEETGEWRHPDDLVGLLARLPEARPAAGSRSAPGAVDGAGVDALAWAVLGDDPGRILHELQQVAAPEELARAVAYAAALRLTRFHVQNDHGDWDVVHHGFTAANALHQMIVRAPTPEMSRGAYQVAMKVFLDRFLNVPAARLPGTLSEGRPDLAELQACWDHEGRVDEAGAIVYGWLRSGGGREAVLATLGACLLAEDSQFHWFQTYEAAVRQSAAWPEGSEQAALILAGTARFLAAHTPTRRELSQVVRIANRLRRGEALYEELSV